MESTTKNKRIESTLGVINQSFIGSSSFWWLWYGAGLPLILAVATWLAWNRVTFHPKAIPMVVLVSLAYVTMGVGQYKMNNYRSYKTVGLSLFYLSVAFLVIFTILAAFRFYYSRMFLFTGYGLTAIWMLAGALFLRQRIPNYLIITGGIADRLRRTVGVTGWTVRRKLSTSHRLSEYDGIVVDLHAHDNEKKLLRELGRASLHNVPIIHAATVMEQYRGQADLDYVAEEGLYGLSPHSIYPLLKRCLEVGITVLLSPLILTVAAIAALAVKLTSKGPVLFTQERVGRYGETYTLYKFRSMTADSEKDGAQFASHNDMRVTAVGKFIRKFRIDELPQFWNILRGDMSLIGPRPEQQTFVESFNDEIAFYPYRHKVRPGITGWAQVKDGYAADLDATKIKLQHDLYYIKNISLSLDLLIIFATVKTILTGFGSR